MSDTQSYEESKQAMDDFAADFRHIRFKEDIDSNWTCLTDFLDSHSLELTAENLHFAYESLVAEDRLQLMPLGEVGVEPLAPPDPQPVQPTAQPTPVPRVAATPSRKQTQAFRNGQPINIEGARRL